MSKSQGYLILAMLSVINGRLVPVTDLLSAATAVTSAIASAVFLIAAFWPRKEARP